MKGLTAIQRLWILANLNADFERQEQAMNGGSSKSVNISSEGTDSSDLAGLMQLAKHGRQI